MTLPHLETAREVLYVSEVHVIPRDGQEDWTVRATFQPGRSDDESFWKTQKEAEKRARELLEGRPEGGDVVLHGRDGGIRHTTHIAYKAPE